jgi:SAM-dependent methyltransferase
MFPRKRTAKTELAFGKIPAYCKYELFMERYRSASEFIKQAHEGKASIKLLDVGCGEGYLKYFCDFGKIDWTGIEIWKERVETCKKLGYKIFETDIDREKFPFPDSSFDVLVASHVLEHLHDRAAVVKEMFRVLKPGGTLIVAVPIKPVIINTLLTFFWNLSAKAKGETVFAYNLYSFKDFLKISLDGNFDFVDVRGFRLISSKRYFNWENNLGFYKFNTWWGKTFPSLSPEVNAVLRKKV